MFFNSLKMLLHFHLASTVSDEKSFIFMYIFFLGHVSFLSDCLQDFLFIFCFQPFENNMPTCVFLYISCLDLKSSFGSLNLLDLCFVFINFRKFLAITSSNMFLPLSLFSCNYSCVFVRSFDLVPYLLDVCFVLFCLSCYI